MTTLELNYLLTHSPESSWMKDSRI